MVLGQHIVGHEARWGKPLDFGKLVRSRLAGRFNSRLLQMHFSALVETHGLYYQLSVASQEGVFVTPSALVGLILPLLTNFDEGDRQTLQLLLIRHSFLNKTKRTIKLLTTFSIPKPVGSSKVLRRKIILFSSKPPSELAEMLCWITESLLKSICSHEFYKCHWMKDQKALLAPNISRAISFFNFLCWRAASEIVMGRTVEERSYRIDYLIEAALHARQCGNFEVVSALIAALNSCPVAPSRLKQTWQCVTKKGLSCFEQLESLVAPVANYAEYRSLAELRTQLREPVIPILSVILRDVVSAEINVCSNESESDPNDQEQEILLGRIIWPVLSLQQNMSSVLCTKKQYERHGPSLKKLLEYSPGSEDLLMELSYRREPPKNRHLLDQHDTSPTSSDAEDPTLISNSSSAPDLISLRKLTRNSSARIQHRAEQELSDSDTEGSERVKPLFRDQVQHFRSALEKDPAMWDQDEVRVVLESWGLPAGLSIDLATNTIVDGKSLLRFVPTEATIPQLQYRVLMDCRIEELLRDRVPQRESSCDDTFAPRRSPVVPRSHSRRNQSDPVRDNISKWNRQRVLQWAEAHFEELLPIFADSCADGKKLLALTDSDLLQMGIDSPITRKSVLKEIRRAATSHIRRRESKLTHSH